MIQTKYYDDYGREIGWVDFTDHGYPLERSSPHWHEVQWNAQYPIGGYKMIIDLIQIRHLTGNKILKDMEGIIK